MAGAADGGGEPVARLPHSRNEYDPRQLMSRRALKPLENSPMRFVILSALALTFAVPAVASAVEADVVVRTHHKHYNNNEDSNVVVNEDGQRLHHRHHGQVAFYDHGKRAWHRHHQHNTVVVVSSVPTRHVHRHPVVIENSGY
jgi:hypothetical protein